MNWFEPLPNAFFSTATSGPLPDKKILALFSEEDSMWLKMVGNDIDKFAKGLD